jgi:hypothetical protein
MMNIVLATAIVMFAVSRLRCRPPAGGSHRIPTVVWLFVAGWATVQWAVAAFILLTWADTSPPWFRAVLGQALLWTSGGLLTLAWLQDRFMDRTNRWVVGHVESLHRQVAAISSVEAADRIVDEGEEEGSCSR